MVSSCDAKVLPEEVVVSSCDAKLWCQVVCQVVVLRGVKKCQEVSRSVKERQRVSRSVKESDDVVNKHLQQTSHTQSHCGSFSEVVNVLL